MINVGICGVWVVVTPLLSRAGSLGLCSVFSACQSVSTFNRKPVSAGVSSYF